MSDEEETTDKQLQNALDLYENDMQEWDAEILLDELEHVYKFREQINRIILTMKADIQKVLEGK